MSSYNINTIKTGKGLAGSSIAVIFAPEDAPAGSLMTLTDFLNSEEPVRAVPGYYGPNKEHVLRVSGLDNDNHLLELLTQRWPEWKSAHDNTSVTVSPDIHFSPVSDPDYYHNLSPIESFVKEHASTLAGLSYVIGNLGLLYSAVASPQTEMAEETQRDWFKASASVAYSTAAGILLATSGKADKSRNVYDIVNDTYSKAQAGDSFDIEQPEQNIAQRAIEFVRTHPWEINSAINATGMASYLVSATRRLSPDTPEVKYEILSVLGGLTAMAITASPSITDKKDSNVLIQERSGDQSVLNTVETMQDLEPEPNDFINTVKSLKQWIQNNQLKVAAGISATSNVGFAVAALKQTPYDAGLLASSGAYLAGNVLQTFADKVRHPAFDDVVTAAASIMHCDPALDEENPKQVQERINNFAEVLSDEYDIVHDEQRIAKGIEKRLTRFQDKHCTPHSGFTDEEKSSILKDSPFLANSYVDQVVGNQDGSSSATLIR